VSTKLLEVTIVYTGIMVGNIASGPAGVRFGRREAVLASYFGSLAVCWCSNFEGFSVLPALKLR